MELFGGAETLQQVTLPKAYELAQEYFSHNYSSLLNENNGPQKRDKMIAGLRKYITDQRLTVGEMDQEALILRLYEEMVEFSFLTPYLNHKIKDSKGNEIVEGIEICEWYNILIS